MKLKLMDTKKGRIIITVVFIAYLLLLTKVILFKYPISMMRKCFMSNKTYTLSDKIKASNLIPMNTIFYYLGGNEGFNIARENILGNVVAFGPLGFLLPLVFRGIKGFTTIILSSFILSLTFELIQLFTGTGSFDVDDILLNVLGSICGYILYKRVNNFIEGRQI